MSKKITKLKSGLKKEGLEEKLRYDLIPMGLLERLAKQYTYGAKKYGENNWKKSTKEESELFKQAAFRHFIKWISNVNDGEDHAIACVTDIFDYEWLNKNK